MTARASAVPPSSEACAGAPFWYTLYGLRIRSDVPLPPIPELRDPGTGPADCVLRVMPVSTRPAPGGRLVAGLSCAGPCHRGRHAARVHRGPGGTWFWHDGIGTSHVRPGARQVDVYPVPEVDARALAVVLVGPVATLVLHQLGYPSLHASAVQLGSRAAAFLGPQGQGKSTMAALLLRRGATLLTDDILPLSATVDGVYGLPSVPMMRLTPDTLWPALDIVEPLPRVTDTHHKRLLTLAGRFPFGQSPVRVAAVYVLERYDPVASERSNPTIRPLSGRDGLTALLAHTSNRALLEPAENEVLLPLYARLLAQARPVVLSYPHGFQYQDAISRHLLADLDARP